jgi:hypothetical protein
VGLGISEVSYIEALKLVTLDTAITTPKESLQASKHE